jgi:Secretion system C-terminal sorting domain
MKKILLIFFLCFLYNSNYSQSKRQIKQDSLNFAILFVNYQTYNFEEGNLSFYQSLDSATDKIPMKYYYETPVDYGKMYFLYDKTNDTLFSGGIEWQGRGHVTYPKEFLPADSFEVLQTTIIPPKSINYYFNLIPELDSANYKLKADSAWNKVKNLDVVNDFAKYSYRVGLCLYTPGIGVPVQGGFSDTVGAKWIIFLYYDNSTISRINNSKGIPGKYLLQQNYPNPFNPTTKIKYQIPKESFVTITLYDLLGREVRTLVKAQKSAGSYELMLDGSELSSGIYFYTMISGNYAAVQKLILLK